MDTTTAVVALLEWTQARLARRLHLPSATYRLQMHRGFTFRDAERLADYLDRLGVSDVETERPHGGDHAVGGAGRRGRARRRARPRPRR